VTFGSIQTGPAVRDLFNELIQRRELLFRGHAQVAYDLERFDALFDRVEDVDQALAAAFCQTADLA
jgi:hypothetical protein